MLSTASAASARGQTEEEASLNVREWIREADYASEVRAEQSERKEKAGASEGEFVCVRAFLVGLRALCVYDMSVCMCWFVGLCVLVSGHINVSVHWWIWCTFIHYLVLCCIL